MRYLIIMLIVGACSTAIAANHDFTGLPLTSDGWTDLEAVVGGYTDSRIVYVSTSGNDTTAAAAEGGDGFYTLTDSEVSGANTVFEPSGIVPYLTYSAAYSKLRDGYADILLFKRGDSWTDAATISVSKSGVSQTVRFIIGAYGSSGDRPSYGTEVEGINLNENGTASYLIIADLELYPYDRQPAEGPTGIEWGGTSQHTLFEGNYIHNYENNINARSPNLTWDGHNSITSNIAYRRNVVYNSWSTTSHCQGVYSAKQGLTLYEENVWDHNGWDDPPTGTQYQNVRSRNMYMDYYEGENLIIRGEISSRSGSEGLQMRYGGVYKHNLNLKNSTGIEYGHLQTKYEETGEITENVFLDADDMLEKGEASSPRGRAIIVGNRTQDVEIDGNIIAHQVTAVAATGLMISHDQDMKYQEDGVDYDPAWPKVYTDNPIFTNNIVYDWYGTNSSNTIAFYIGQSARSMTFQNNLLQQDNNGLLAYNYEGTWNTGPEVDWVFSGNTYYSTNSTPFDGINVSAMNYASWIPYVDESGSSNSQVSYTDPDRTIETYATLMGLNPSDYEDGLDKFLTQVRAQSRFNWDEDYTAYAVINYVRAGFDLDPVSAEWETSSGSKGITAQGVTIQ